MSNLIFSQVFIHYFSQKSRTTTKLFSSEPPFNIYETKGRIFGIIEINTPNRENSKILSQLIDFIEHYYYSTSPELSVLESFEETLQKANAEFEAIVNSSGTMLMGTLTLSTLKEKINLVVGVVHNNQIHVCTLNSMGAYLIYRTNQEYKTISIANHEPANGELFSTVISGECNPGNYLFFCNTQLTQHISQERFTKTITSLSPSKAADYFKNSLIGYDGFNFAALIIQNPKDATQAKLNPSSLSTINVLNQKEAETEKLLSTSFFPQFNFKMPFSFKEKFTSVMKKSTSQGTVETKTETQVIHTPSPSVHVAPKRQQSFGSQLTHAFHEFKNSQFAISTSLKFKRMKNYLANVVNNLPSLTKLLTLVFCIILIFFGYSIYKSNPQALTNVISQFTENKELTTLEEEVAQAQAKVISGDTEAAKPLLAAIESKIPTLKINNNNDQARLNEINDTLNVLIAQIRKITIVSDPMILATLPLTSEQKVSHITHTGNNVVAITNDSNSVSIFNTLTKTVLPLTGPWEGGVVTAATLDGTVSILDTQNRIHELTSTNTFLTKTITSQSPVADITTYNERLYTLTPSNNQLNRHTLAGTTYQSGITWIQESGINLTNAISLSLDTRVWIAFSNGTVQKFFKGFKQAFSLQQIEPSLTSITDFIKPESSKFLYLLDSEQKRIVVFNDEGVLITQYYSPSLTSLDSMTIDETAKTIYVTSGNQLIAIFMQH